MIYFVQCNPPDGPIKIGYTTSILKKMEQFERYNGYVCRLLLLIKGDRKTESQIHKECKAAGIRYNDCKIVGKEWFHYTDKIKAIVDKLRTNKEN